MELVIAIFISLALGGYMGYRLHANLVRAELLLLEKFRGATPQQRNYQAPGASARRSPRSNEVIEMEQQPDGSYAVKR